MTTPQKGMTPDYSPQPLYPNNRVKRHLSELFRLAVPVVIARIGMLIMSVVDTIIVGNYDSSGLAYLNVAHAPFISLLVTGVGLLTGIMIMTSHAVGRKNYLAAGHVWRACLPYAVLLGFGLGALAWNTNWLFEVSGQPAEITLHATDLGRILAIGMPAALIYTACSFFMEGLQRPLPGMIMMLLANVVNLFLDYGLVNGAFGMPELGASGAAWTSSIIRWLMAFAMLAYVLMLKNHALYGLRDGFSGWWGHSREARSLGYASGASQGMETAAFSAMQLFAGRLGIVAAASYGITMTILALMFMFAMGLASATSVRVGIAYGRRDRADMALAGWIGLVTTMVVMFCLSLPVYFFPGWVANLFSEDALVIAGTSGLLILMPIIFPTDGGQNAAINALRGTGEKWAPTMLHMFSYIFVMIPAGYYLAFVQGLGVSGLFWGIAIASLVAVSGLAIRFKIVSGRELPSYS
ncbi:MATE family efflux transporter [Thalassospira marina]|uniref:Multidrug-efflux transporter n=1 Tax=Thalassospira marina TaxID=2048283 RepID=A0A2N3KSF1_9PROT|nr:MATE family efflux transporter [Thalassospira marina]AUG51424.1 MATE family efflux transporter [Thalassospira marina]PKR53475.1 MATE family efflux transporter [Thalassospira marina]